MTTYKETHGINIKVLSSDPPAPFAGQIWYNSTSNTLKGFLISLGTWATGGALNTGRQSGESAIQGTNTAALMFGGQIAGAPYAALASTESYNGSAWTNQPSLGTARYSFTGMGVSTSALAAGRGAGDKQVESYNGSWTAATSLNTDRNNAAGSGASNTSALMIGGNPGSKSQVESWNGSWTILSPTLNTGRDELGGVGTQTAALAIGGDASNKRMTESWNGSTWTNVNDLITGSRKNASGGSSTSAIDVGTAESPFVTGVSQSWNGSSWSTVGSLNTARSQAAGSGSSSNNSLVFGGNSAGDTLTEEFSSGPATVTFAS
tara:strand:- start:3795 stop:4754 length:960 start_codon:yes stop_codon:yes gene_type:complete